MSHFQPGALGKFIGKTGEVVTCKWRDIYVGRATPSKTKKKASAALKNQRAKVGLISNFSSIMADATAIGFPSKRKNLTAITSSIKYNVKHAVSGALPDLKIDYAKVQLSKGWLDQVYTPSMLKTGDSTVQVKWLNSPNLKLGVEEYDAVHVFFYSETAYNKSGRHAQGFENVAFRSDGTVEIQFFKLMAGYMGTFQGWIFLTSADGKKVSNTKYLGEVQMMNPITAELSENE